MVPVSRPYSEIYPRQYIALRAPPSSPGNAPAITIDGNLDKPFWDDVEWTEDFVDIATNTSPKFRTKVKMRWDDNFLYVGAYMEENDVWGTLTEHNSVIFHDNDFEIFVDTDASNHNYKEFEINALGTVWSLQLNKPYADNGGENSKRVNPDGYDMTTATNNINVSLQSATKVYPNDAINQPDVRNTHWTVEVAIPITKLIDGNPTAKHPQDGMFWRVNFSRVQWGVKVNEDGRYEKKPCCQSCATPGTCAEDNWVWSKQGEVAMHLPERWGVLQFESKPQSKVKYYDEWPTRCAAMAIYYAMKGYHESEGRYTIDIEALKAYSKPPFELCEQADVVITVTPSGDGYTAQAAMDDSSYTATVNQERYLTISAREKYTTTSQVL